MPLLNNPLLSIAGLISEFKKELLQEKPVKTLRLFQKKSVSERSPKQAAPTPLQRFKYKLVAVYWGEAGAHVLKDKSSLQTLEAELLKAEISLQILKAELSISETSHHALKYAVFIAEELTKALRDKCLKHKAALKISLQALQADKSIDAGYQDLQTALDTILALDESFDKPKLFKKLTTLKEWSPDDARLQAEFQRLNEAHGFFKTSSSSAVAAAASDEQLSLFKTLVCATRKTAVLFEKNCHDESMPYAYAYKLMALFVNPEQPITDDIFHQIANKANKQVAKSGIQTHQPFHDVFLVLTLPDAHALHDLPGWQALIIKTPHLALQYFQNAVAIEAKISETTDDGPRAPQDIQEAKAMNALCSYERADEDREFSKICAFYKVTEKRFNQCLDYMQESPGWPKKTTDPLPNIIIEGTGDAKGYYWVKLPPQDKRILILGDITVCCQSIGGLADAAVRDSASNHAAYVILKEKTTGNPKPLSANDPIDYTKFHIVAEAYAWKSTTGNICLDSLEYIRERVTDDVLSQLTMEFAKAALEADKSLHCVTIGSGGNTPQGNFGKKLFLPEVMKQAAIYSDADEQFCLARRNSVRSSEEQTALDTLLASYSYEFKACIDYLLDYLPDQSKAIATLTVLLEKHLELSVQLDRRTIFRFIAYSDLKPDLSDLELIDFDAVETQSAAKLLWRDITVMSFSSMLLYILNEHPIDVFLMSLQQKNYDVNYDSLYTPIPLLMSIINNGDIAFLNLVLQAVPSKERFNLFKQITVEDRYGLVPPWNLFSNPMIIEIPGALKIILKYLTPEESFKAATYNLYANDAMLVRAAKTELCDSFKAILDKLGNKDWYIKLFQYKFTDAGKTVLHLFPSSNNILMLREYLSEDEYLDALLIRDDEDETPLENFFLAAEKEEIKIFLKDLTSEGFEKILRSVNQAGNNLLHVSAERANITSFCELLNLLLCAKKNQFLYGFFSMKNKEGNTVLDIATTNYATFQIVAHLFKNKSQEIKDRVFKENSSYLFSEIEEALGEIWNPSTCSFNFGPLVHMFSGENEIYMKKIYKMVEKTDETTEREWMQTEDKQPAVTDLSMFAPTDAQPKNNKKEEQGASAAESKPDTEKDEPSVPSTAPRC